MENTKYLVKKIRHAETQHTKPTYDLFFSDKTCIKDVIVSHQPFNKKSISFYFYDIGDENLFAYNEINKIAYFVKSFVKFNL